MNTILVFHAKMANLSAAPVQLIDYRLNMKMKSGQIVTLHAHSGVSLTLHVAFGGEEYVATFEHSCFMTWPPRAVNFGELQMGFLCFTHSEELSSSDVSEYRFTVVDVFNRKHTEKVSQAAVDQWNTDQNGATIGFWRILEHAGVTITTRS